MSRRFRDELTYANIMSTIAVVLALTTGTAYASHLVVRSSDVVDGTLESPDLMDGYGVRGVDVVDGSLKGRDITESTLDLVPAAEIGGLGEFSQTWDCDPETGPIPCAVVTLDLPRRARVVLSARIDAEREPGASGVPYAYCRLGSTSGHVARTDVDALVTDRQELSTVGMTGVLGPGRHSFGIDCDDPAGDVRYSNAKITAVAISPN